MASFLIHTATAIFLIWLALGLVVTVIGMILAKTLPQNMIEADADADRPSWFVETPRQKHLRESFVNRRDRIKVAIERERKEYYEAQR